ncbi:MAG TPA: hypothetical protein PLE74_12745 [Candidatus Cloacimonadota bacterium]|nr:hypothetical protein [Candidatus Cloacimonadota bacterium]HPT73135.1 hypothetical protein [Candidatus Cloacimonadota bacterium]
MPTSIEIFDDLNHETVLQTRRAMGFPIFTGAFDLMFTLFRTSEGVGEIIDDNHFNDVETVLYNAGDGKSLILEKFWCTTDPGLTGLLKPENHQGCAILAEGYNKSAWKLGLHTGKRALVQCAPIWIFRDNDRTNKLSFNGNPRQVTGTGIDNHRCREDRIVQYVDDFSHGCCSVPNFRDMERILFLMEKQRSIGLGDKVSFGLVNEPHIVWTRGA